MFVVFQCWHRWTRSGLTDIGQWEIGPDWDRSLDGFCSQESYARSMGSPNAVHDYHAEVSIPLEEYR